MTTCPTSSTNCHFSCPSGGTWFICPDAPYFVGCCASDPCKNPASAPCRDLHPASFNTSLFPQILPNDCIGQTSSDWYACNFTKPSFLGCCKNRPTLLAMSGFDANEYPFLPTNLFNRPTPGLPRRRSRYFRGSRAGGRPVAIPMARMPASSMDPMQRWQESPPESEAASLSAIANALQRTSVRDEETRSRSSRERALSSGSVDGWTTGSSRSIASSTGSRTSSFQSFQTTSRGRVRKARKSHASADSEQRRYPCTFCCDTFKRKHDWTRHEKSLHLDLDQWVCAPHGGSVLSPLTGRSHCAYCNVLDPTPDHLEGHNHTACHKDHDARIFRRKDHLVQHLRVFHHLDTMPIIDDWKMEPPTVVSRCGFCDQQLSSWEMRADHLSEHFRRGLTIKDWRGDHGLDPSIAVQVRNALPPYVLGTEAGTMIPFSATDPRTKDHLHQMSYKNGDMLGIGLPEEQEPELDSKTYANFLVSHLERFAQQSMAQGMFPDDKMLQDESRRLIYGDAGDAWEQTIADNIEWLAEFRRRHLMQEYPLSETTDIP
ncbi:hypothetical protein BO70DRAFT_373783 [Aspergillus heteromorphus CBS 117.55]|uniref:C2H2-type domain-containing protein n=1 Tax=Aspergillus heteromorphus CBS 117.55 TaxID=1448321 RepID=A0A317VCQ6_9EURO|nr:uncharacterized protein BO70DRAFT_373783 [Aspergillus heteromorphus CBS 117.55]PWY71031.1 hypothetical protein BO70DRAFT_373783 [Aspergillus heteromorphus CBS 117.55]